jgi:hypothetical protein
MNCWASELGGCSNKQSREHYISEGLWKNRHVTIRGFNWLDGQEKTIPLPSLTAKILCTAHNQLLSPLDSEAIHVFKALDEIWRLQEVRRKLRPTKFWLVKRYEAHGNLFERWVAKTVIGLFCVIHSDLHWHQTQAPCIQPPPDVLRAVYGHRSFDSPMGLYLAIDTGDKYDFPDSIGFESWIHPAGGLGGVLSFKDIKFPVWLSPEPIDQFSFEIGEGKVFGRGGTELVYRLRAGRFTVRKVLSQVLTFNWE